MREVKAIVFDSLAEFNSNKGFSMHQVAMAEFIYLIKEKTFVKHRYAPYVTATQKPQSIPDGTPDRICYRI